MTVWRFGAREIRRPREYYYHHYYYHHYYYYYYYYLLPTTYYLLSCFLLINTTYYPQNPCCRALVAFERGAHFRALAAKLGLPCEAFANLQRVRQRAKSRRERRGPCAASVRHPSAIRPLQSA